MVSKLLIWFFLSSLPLQAAASFLMPMGLRLYWEGQKSPRCQHLVEIFLAELRSMATDHVIELEVNEKNDSTKIEPTLSEHAKTMEPQKTLRPLHINCEQDKADILDIKDEESLLKMHYLAKASGFDSMDWLPFQEKYLRFSPLNTETYLSTMDHSKSGFPILPITQSDVKKDSVFQQWWFWGVLGGVIAGSTYLLTRSGEHNQQVTMEVH